MQLRSDGSTLYCQRCRNVKVYVLTFVKVLNLRLWKKWCDFFYALLACLGASKFIRNTQLYLVIKKSTITAHDSSISTCYEIVKQTSLFINMGKHENVTAVYLLCLLEKCSTQNQKGNSSSGDSKSFRLLK